MILQRVKLTMVIMMTPRTIIPMIVILRMGNQPKHLILLLKVSRGILARRTRLMLMICLGETLPLKKRGTINPRKIRMLFQKLHSRKSVMKERRKKRRGIKRETRKKKKGEGKNEREKEGKHKKGKTRPSPTAGQS